MLLALVDRFARLAVEEVEVLTLWRYEGGIFPQLLCERDRIVLVGR
jgi:hypothetical protein